MITILTHKKNKNIKTLIRNLIKYIFIFFTQKLYLDINRFIQILKFSGHVDVTKSLINGLKENNIVFNINPKLTKNYHRKLIVLSGYDELLMAINLKKRKIIDYLIAGPNICILPSDIGDIFNSKEINTIITPSKWVSDSYAKDLPTICDKLKEWPAGVDINYWKPLQKKTLEYVLIYIKKPFTLKKIKNYINFLNNKKIKFKIIYYGYYNNKNYLKVLQNSKYCIFFSISESQSIAMLESWSVGVPSLIHNNNLLNYKLKKIVCDTSPYLSKNTGFKFKNLNDFMEKILFYEKNYHKYNTREWVKQNLTDKLSSKILIDIIT